jgi:hypothetical protein
MFIPEYIQYKFIAGYLVILWFAALALVDPSPEFKFGNTFDEHFYP